MPILPKNRIDFSTIHSAHSLIDVAGRDVELIQNGSEYKCICPFHDDKNPSCTFYQGRDGTERFKCFACGAGGDVIDWVSQIENVDTATAIRILQGENS